MKIDAFLLEIRHLLAWLAVEWRQHKLPSVLGIISGAVAGLVAITPACAFVSPMGSVAIGLLAGLACFHASTALKRKLGYDDALDVFSVHGIGGFVGVIGTGLFANSSWGGTGGFAEGNIKLLGLQVLACLVVTAWCATASYAILKVIDVAIGLRVGKEAEIEGLDVQLHGEVAQ